MNATEVPKVNSCDRRDRVLVAIPHQFAIPKNRSTSLQLALLAYLLSLPTATTCVEVLRQASRIRDSIPLVFRVVVVIVVVVVVSVSSCHSVSAPADLPCPSTYRAFGRNGPFGRLAKNHHRSLLDLLLVISQTQPPSTSRHLVL